MKMVSRQEGLSIVGIVTVRAHPRGTIDTLQQLHTRRQHRKAQALLSKGKIASVSRNKVVDSSNYGIDIFRQWLVSAFTGVNSFTVGPGWVEIGTGSTTPTVADTALETPSVRVPISYAINTGSASQLQFYMSDSTLPNGTYTEGGSFIGGTSTLGSGTMMNHALFTSSYVKSTGTDTTIEVDFTISNV